MSGTGIDVAPNLTTCPVPVLMLYQLTEMSGTGIDVPNSPKCPVPVIPAVYTVGIPRYVPYRTHPWTLVNVEVGAHRTSAARFKTYL